MTEIASQNQLRMSYTRWALVMVPLMILLGSLSGILSNSGYNNHWFAALARPAMMPPAWAFPVAWTILYALMGLSLALILDARRASGRRLAVGLFILQLVLNLAWSPVFFALHKVHFAVLLIVMILVAAIATVIAFKRIRPLAAYLLVPYLLWLSFAAVLNYQIDQLNPNAAHLGTAAGTAHIDG